MSEKIVTFEEWESGKVKLTNEVFDKIVTNKYLVNGIGSTPRILEIYHYKGRETGTLLGSWFSEVMEQEAEQ